MVKERRGKELPQGKPRGRVKHSSSTRRQRKIAHSHARSPSIQPVDWEERYHALFDRSLQYAIIQDFEGNILDANEVVLKLLGYDREDIPHLNIASLLSEDQLPKASAALQELKDTGMTKQVSEWRLKRKDGSFVDMLLSGALIYREGKPDAVLGIGIDITERKRAEEALRLQAEILRTMAEGVVITRTKDAVIVYTNPKFEEMFGYGPGELIGKNISVVNAPTDKSPEELARDIQRDLKETGVWQGEICNIKKDGTFFWCHANVSTFNHPEHGNVWVDVHTNITEHKQAEQTLKDSEEKYRELADSVTDVFFAMDEHLRYTYWNKASEILTGIRVGDAIGKSLREIFPDTPKTRNAEKMYLKVLKTQQPQTFVNDFDIGGRHYVFEISAYPSRGGISAFVKDITERKRTEESLHLSERNFRDSIEKSPLGIRIVTADGTTLYVNKTLLDICGYGSLEELKAVPRNQLYTPESYVEHRERVNKRKRREYVPSNYEISIVRKDGQVRRLSVSRGEVLWDGERQFQIVYPDITESKRAEEALAKSEERYRQLAENAGEAIFVIQDSVIKFINPKGAELSGYSIQELVSKPFVQLIHPDDVDMVADRYARRLKGELIPQIYEFRIIRKDGDIRWGELNAVPISWENRPAVLCFMNDVTERKKAEEALRQSEERYRTILEEMGDGYFETDLAGNITFVNDAMIRRLGYSKEELIRMNYRALRPKEEAKAVFEAYNRMYKTGEPLRNFFTEIICKDGSHIFAETSAFPIRNEKGEIIGFRGIRRDITERKQAEEALRQSEERYRTILEEMEEGYYEVDLAGTFTFVNDAMSRILGYSRDELIGMNYKVYTPKENAKPIFQAYNRVYRTGEPLKWYPMAEVRKDGTLILAEDSVLPLLNEKGEVIGFRGISRNVTERKKAEEALRQSEERYRAILEEMQDSYFEVDLGGHITFINSAGCRHLGYSMEELIGKRMSYKDFTDEDYIKSIFQTFNEVYRTGVPNKGFNWKIIRKDGSAGFIDNSVSPLRNAKGEVIGFSGVGRDVTERRKIEEQLILTDRLASVGQLAAGIAHELNNPLTGVIGFSDLLLERDLPADVKEDLETVNQEAKRAVNIVKGLLAFAREQRTEKTLVNINTIIQGVLQIRSYEQRVSNIEVAARLAPALSQVMGNGVQLQQVFINIIVNAEQAMIEAHGRGKLTIVTEQVGEIVRASITDDGPGISPDNMKQLFTPFFTTREVGKGTGLGLSICHGIVTEHGGKLYAESKLGKGATFVVELPISK
jgi:PAS domain S-box-containing protein